MKEKNHLAQKTLFSPHIGAKMSAGGGIFGHKTGVHVQSGADFYAS